MSDPLPRILEALIFVSDEPLAPADAAEAVEAVTGQPVPVDEVEAAVEALNAAYRAEGRAFRIHTWAGGYRMATVEELAPFVRALKQHEEERRLSRAQLETLAVVAYKQPVSRARVSAVRGVNVDGVMRTLLTRGLVEEAGQDAETGAILYRTTGYFLERIGITSLADLPELAPFLPEMEDLEDEPEGLAAS